MASQTKFGLLLPHFGGQASPRLILHAATRAEELGFDSVWVRDHLIFHPHGMEGTDTTYFEAFTILNEVASITRKVLLGAGTIIPFRHPVHLALLAANLDHFSNGRFILGFGAGTFQHEFDVLGWGQYNRPELVRENVAILRKLWTQDEVSHDGPVFHFHHVDFKPKPARPIPIWYGGNTPAAARRAVEYCDGWIPGRITVLTYQKRIRQIRRLCDEAGRPMITTGAIPIVSIDADYKTAAGKVNVPGLVENANQQKWWVRPPHGEFRTLEDLEGSVLIGSPQDVVAQVRRIQEAGIDHLVFDLRFRFGDFDRCVDLIAKEVIPALRR